MSVNRTLPFLVAVGCAPVLVQGTGADAGSETADDEPYESIDGNGQSGADDSGDDGGDAEQGTDAEPTVGLRSGEYYFQSYDFAEDPCGWEGYLDAGIDLFLPDSFIVDADEGGFDIEAQRIDTNYGVDGPVRCTLEGNDFSCDIQDVSPSRGLLGQYGWSYEVTFTGYAESPTVLRGTSLVRFIVTSQGLSVTGLSPDTDTEYCTQVLDMTLRRGGSQ